MLVGNKYLEETVTDFVLTGPLKSPTVVNIDAERVFSGAGDNIRLPTTEVLLCAAIKNPSKSKKLRDWVALNAVLIPKFITDAVVFKGEKKAGEPRKT